MGGAGLTLGAEATHQLALGGELKDLVEAGIGGPHVAVLVHAQSVNDVEYTLAEGAQELPLGIEDHDGVGRDVFIAGDACACDERIWIPYGVADRGYAGIRTQRTAARSRQAPA